MQKIIKVDNKVIVMVNGVTYARDCSDELFKQIVNAKDDSEIIKIMNPEYGKQLEKYNKALEFMNKFKDSMLLTMNGDCIYWKEVSGLSVPMELAEAVLNAELNHDETKIETYRNFWTLMSLNTDPECRKNLFWFLNRNGLKLSKQGFFVAYRNVVPNGVDEDGNEVFTDYHSHTTVIKIGEMVTIPRESCDCDSNVECSRGLHLASRTWLNKNYFGSVGMVCLCNPADVVAVPYDSLYGKLRTCAYLPIEKLEYGEDNKPIPYPAEDGFDCSYITKVIYEGLMGTEEDSTYKIEIPEAPEINKVNISDKLLDIAMKCITEKQI